MVINQTEGGLRQEQVQTAASKGICFALMIDKAKDLATVHNQIGDRIEERHRIEDDFV